MKTQLKNILIFTIAFAFAAPAVQAASETDAHARPFSIVREASQSGKRTHKKKSSSRKKSSSKKSSSCSSCSTSRRTTTTTRRRRPTTTQRRTTTTHRRTTTTHRRPTTTHRRTTTTTTRRRGGQARHVSTTRRPVDRTTTQRRTTTHRRRTTTHRRPTTTTHRRTTVYHRTPARRTTTHRRHTTYRRTTVHRAPARRTTVVHRRPAPRRTVNRVEVHHYHSRPATTTRRTEVHHHHHRSRPAPTTQRTEVHHYHSGRNAGGSTVNEREDRNARSPRRERKSVYLTGGMGFSGIAAEQITDQALPGMDFQVGLGARQGLMVGELGFNMAGWRFDSAQAANTADLMLLGVTADLKLQPSIAFFEPYAMAGVGGHVFNDHVIDASATGASLRLGAGADFRFNNVALNANYTRSFMGFVGDASIYQDGTLGAQSETLGVGLKFYF